MTRLMTIVAVGLLCCVSLGARAADEPRITMQLNDISVSDALRKVFAQAKVRCVIDGEVAGRVQALSLSDVPLKTAVRTLARYANADFEVKNNVYVIRPKSGDPPHAVNSPPATKTAVPEPVAGRKPPRKPEPANKITFVERKAARVTPSHKANTAHEAAPTAQWMSGQSYRPPSANAADYARARLMYGPPSVRFPNLFLTPSMCAPSG